MPDSTPARAATIRLGATWDRRAAGVVSWIRRPRPRAALVAVLLATTVACADDGPDASGPPVSPTGEVVDVIALDNSFRPEVIEVRVGDEVRFVNRGRNEHDALSVDGDDWGVEVDDFGPGAEYRHVFTSPGTYRYYCSIHGTTEVGMVGTVVVVP